MFRYKVQKLSSLAIKRANALNVESNRYLLSFGAPLLVCWSLICSLIDLGNNFSSFIVWSVSAVKSDHLCIVKRCLNSWNKLKFNIPWSKQDFYFIGRSICCMYLFSGWLHSVYIFCKRHKCGRNPLIRDMHQFITARGEY